MDFVIELLSREQKNLEKLLKQNNLMRTDMPLATTIMSNISQIKKVVKIIKNKSTKL